MDVATEKLWIQKASIVIPARNEAGSIEATLQNITGAFNGAGQGLELVVVDDGSTDETWEILRELQSKIPELRPLRNLDKHGFGRAIASGIEAATGDAIIIMMADESDSPQDALGYICELNKGYDCVFGSRFVRGSKVLDYPKFKLLVNRMANLFIKGLFHIRLNDTTNAFKAYRTETLNGLKPILSPHFNITVELPLKAIVRGYSYSVVPIQWQNRKTGESKLKIREMGSRYLFIVLYVWLEKYFSRGDYNKHVQLPTTLTAANATDPRR